MKIVVLGANGRVGSLVAKSLITHGHSVIAGVHKSAHNIPPDASIVELDINDQAAMTHTLAESDAVVCALSSWQAPHHDVLARAMKTVIPAMTQNNVKRIVSISGDVARVPGEQPSILVKLFNLLVFGVARAVIRDSEDHIRQLSESNLDWTVIRPTIMSPSDETAYRFQHTHPFSLTIPRAAVVASIVDLIEQNTHIHQAPFLAPKQSAR